MSRYDARRRSPEERQAKKLRKHEWLRQIKGHYVHKDWLHGSYKPTGDELLATWLERVSDGAGAKQVLVASSQRHVKLIEARPDLSAIWHTEDAPDPDDVLLGRVIRAPELAGPLDHTKLATPAAAAFICERLQRQPNLFNYLVALRQLVAVNGPIGIVVPNAHHELVNDHVNLFTAGTLVYNLVRAGWDCRDAIVKMEGKRFITLLVRRRDVPAPWPLDVDDAGPYMPWSNVFQYCSSEFPDVYRIWSGTRWL